MLDSSTMRAALPFCAALLLPGCARWPASYPPPSQFTVPSTPDPPAEVRLITMNHPEAPFSIVEGVPDAGYGWGFKWTLSHARFQLIAGDLANTDFVIRYGMDPRTLHDRGPVTLTITIDGKQFDTFVEGAVGVYEHRHPAGELTSKTVRALNVSLTIDPPWISEDGSKLGIFLGSIGFVPRS
jgi:hypothetical protein